MTPDDMLDDEREIYAAYPPPRQWPAFTVRTATTFVVSAPTRDLALGFFDNSTHIFLADCEIVAYGPLEIADADEGRHAV